MRNFSRGFSADIGGSVASQDLAQWFRSLRRNRGLGRFQSRAFYGPYGSGAAVEMVGPLDSDQACFEALGYDWFAPWGDKLVTQATQARPATRALIFRNEDGSAFQVAIEVWSRGKWIGLNDWAKAQTRKVASGKYLCGRGENYRPVWTPPIHDSVRAKISQRYGVAVPSTADAPSFWDWLATAKSLPAIVTEGPHKGLAGWSQGFPVLPFSGVDAPVYGEKFGELRGQLRPESAKFLEGRESVTTAFDQDTTGKAIRRVGAAINRLRKALRDLKGGRKTEFLIATWEYDQGKGLDDLIRNQGADSFADALNQAKSWEATVSSRHIKNRLGRKADLTIQLQPGESAKDRAGEIAAAAMGHRVVALVGAKGVGKSELIAQLSAGKSFLSLYHRVSLARAMARTANASYRTDIDTFGGRSILEMGSRITACIDGAIGRAAGVALGYLDQNGFLSGDEWEQLLRHTVDAGTLGDRASQARAYLSAACKTAQTTFLASADLTGWSLNHAEWLASRDGGKERAYVVDVKGWRESWPGSVEFISPRNGIDKALAAAAAALDDGKKLLLATDSKKCATTAFEALRPRLGDTEPGKIYGLLITADTAADPEIQAFMANPDQWLADHPECKLIAHSPTIGSGVSITLAGAFDLVIGASFGVVSPSDFAQSLDRYRQPVERKIFTFKKGLYRGKYSDSWNPEQCLEDLIESSQQAAQVSDGTAAYDPRGALSADNQWNILQSNIDADRNLESSLHGHYLIELLKFEGKKIQTAESTAKLSKEDKAILEQIKEEIRTRWIEGIRNAHQITTEQATAYGRLESLTETQRAELDRYRVERAYAIDLSELSDEDAISWLEADHKSNGRLRRAVSAIQGLLFPEYAKDLDKKSIKRALDHPDTLTANEVGRNVLRANLRKALKFDRLITMNQFGNESELVVEVANTCRKNARQIRLGLGVSIHPGQSNTQIICGLLRGLGIETKMVSQVGSGDARGSRIYAIEQETVTRVQGAAKRREQQRLEENAKQAYKPASEDEDTTETWLWIFENANLHDAALARYGVSSLAALTEEQVLDFRQWADG